MASRTVELKLRVQYERDDGTTPTEDECREILEDLVQHATNRGLLTGDSDLLVEDHRYEIQTVGID